MEIKPYSVALSARIEAGYNGIAPASERRKVPSIIDLLDTVPSIGRLYDPLYEAAPAPSFDCLAAYGGHFDIYYVVDKAKARVTVLHIEDQRRDPLDRFSARR